MEIVDSQNKNVNVNVNVNVNEYTEDERKILDLLLPKKKSENNDDNNDNNDKKEYTEEEKKVFDFLLANKDNFKLVSSIEPAKKPEIKEKTKEEKIKELQYIKSLIQKDITTDLIKKEFSKDNEFHRLAKTTISDILIKKKTKDSELIKFCMLNDLFSSKDLETIIINIICQFTDCDLDIYKYLFSFCIKERDFDKFYITNLINIINTTNEYHLNNLYAYLDWMYKNDNILFIHIMANMIINQTKEKYLSYLEKYGDEIYSANNCYIVQNMCFSYNFDAIKPYLDKLTGDIPYGHFANRSLLNNDERLFLYFNTMKRYECSMASLIAECIKKNKIMTTNVLLENYIGEKSHIADLFSVFKINENNEKMIEELLSHINFDIHYDDDMMLRQMITMENINFIKYLFNNEDKYGKFDGENLRNKINNILILLENEELADLLKNKYNL